MNTMNTTTSTSPEAAMKKMRRVMRRAAHKQQDLDRIESRLRKRLERDMPVLSVEGLSQFEAAVQLEKELDDWESFLRTI